MEPNRKRIPEMDTAFSARVVQAWASLVGARRAAAHNAATAGPRHMSLVRHCLRCHRPLTPAGCKVEEDRFTGEPVTRHSWRCEHCEQDPRLK